MDRVITIANGHLTRAAHDKKYLVMLAAVLCVKLRFVDSIIKHFTVRNFMEIANCSNAKALEISHLFKEYGIRKDNEKCFIVPSIKRYKDGNKKYGGVQKVYLHDGKVSFKKGDRTIEYEISYKNIVKVLEMLTLYNHLYQKQRITDLMQNGKSDSKRTIQKKTALKRKMSQKGVKLDKMSCHRGISQKTLAKTIDVCVSKVKYRLKEMEEAKMIESSNRTNFHKPARSVDYDDVEAIRKKRESRMNVERVNAKKPLTPTEIFKIAYADGDFSLKYHSAVMRDLQRAEMCSKTIKSKLFLKVDDKGNMHSIRNYYVMYPNEYKCLL